MHKLDDVQVILTPLNSKSSCKMLTLLSKVHTYMRYTNGSLLRVWQEQPVLLRLVRIYVRTHQENVCYSFEHCCFRYLGLAELVLPLPLKTLDFRSISISWRRLNYLPLISIASQMTWIAHSNRLPLIKLDCSFHYSPLTSCNLDRRIVNGNEWKEGGQKEEMGLQYS